MAVEYFNDLEEWKAAVVKRGLIVRIYVDDNPNPDEPWEPAWAIRPDPSGTVDGNSPVFGCFQNIPTNEQGTTYSPEGFLCDTRNEFVAQMQRDEDRHDALNEMQITNPTIH